MGQNCTGSNCVLTPGHNYTIGTSISANWLLTSNQIVIFVYCQNKGKTITIDCVSVDLLMYNLRSSFPTARVVSLDPVGNQASPQNGQFINPQTGQFRNPQNGQFIHLEQPCNGKEAMLGSKSGILVLFSILHSVVTLVYLKWAKKCNLAILRVIKVITFEESLEGDNVIKKPWVLEKVAMRKHSRCVLRNGWLLPLPLRYPFFSMWKPWGYLSRSLVSFNLLILLNNLLILTEKFTDFNWINGF